MENKPKTSMRKNWLLNIGLAAVVMALLVWFIFIWLNWYTKHNESVEVPNLKGISLEEASQKLEDADLRFEIFDSVYNKDFKRNAVTYQDPPAKAMVKTDRIIYLTINALGKPKVKMPKLVDQSFALSKAVLKNSGLILGEVTYKYDEIGHNLVIEQLYRGAPILPGKLIDKESKIDLIVATNRRAFAPADSTEMGEETTPDDAPKEEAPTPKKPGKK